VQFGLIFMHHAGIEGLVGGGGGGGGGGGDRSRSTRRREMPPLPQALRDGGPLASIREQLPGHLLRQAVHLEILKSQHPTQLPYDTTIVLTCENFHHVAAFRHRRELLDAISNGVSIVEGETGSISHVLFAYL